MVEVLEQDIWQLVDPPELFPFGLRSLEGDSHLQACTLVAATAVHTDVAGQPSADRIKYDPPSPCSVCWFLWRNG